MSIEYTNKELDNMLKTLISENTELFNKWSVLDAKIFKEKNSAKKEELTAQRNEIGIRMLGVSSKIMEMVKSRMK